MRAKLVKELLTVLLVLGLWLPGCATLPQDSADIAQTLANDIQVLEQKADEDGEVTVVIKLQGASLAGVEEERVVEESKGQAAQSQKKVLEFLNTKGATILSTFWLTNAILAEVPVDLLDELSSLTEVERLFENFTVTIPEPFQEESLPGVLQVGYTWGLEKIGAPEVWDMGITGSGVRVAVLDTGVDITHPDLAGKMWTDDPADPTYPGGWIEFDWDGDIVVGSTPHDTDGHGTHCSGTVLGGNASGIAIGVAPGAFLMHGLVTPEDSATLAQIIAGMQWAIDPFDQYGNPAGEPADVISMSLRVSGYHDAFIEPVQNIKAAGVVLIAGTGNEGEGTSGSPGNVYDAFGIGATDIEDLVADFSSGEVVDWPASHPEPYIKPDFSAPGVDVYSSVPWGYEHWSGTSMATPHVAGAVALMLEANHTLTIDEIYEILNDTAIDLGDEGQDTRYGWGRIDAFAAAGLALSDSGIEGFVTDAETAEPLEGARVFVSETGQARYSDDSGYYRFFLLPGTYNLIVSAFGYYQGNAAVEVVEDAFTPQSFALEPMPTGFIEGTVTDVETDEPIAGAIITLLDTPLSTATDETGEYAIEVPVGRYDVRAWAWGYRASMAPDVVVDEAATATVDFPVEPALAVVAVLGDYNSQLTTLFMANDIWAEERGWDIIGDIGDYDVVVVNCPSDPGESTFLDFLETASDNQVTVVFTSSWPVEAPYGISLLQWYLGDPAGQWDDFGSGDVYYEVREPHPLFEGWEVGDSITIITGGDCDHAWFGDYSGYTIGGIASEDYGRQRDAVALNVYGESVHVLLAGLAPQSDTNATHWTEDAKTIFIRAALATRGLVDMDLSVATTKLPPGVVGIEYQATLKAILATKPYTWAIVDGALPNGLELGGATGVISGTPTEAGTFNFTAEVTDAAEATATRELSICIGVLTEFITDPVGDQFYGDGPDIVGVDCHVDETTIYFRVRTAEPIDPDNTVNGMWLDLDLNASTGFVSPYPDLPTNDIGADAVALIRPGDYGMVGELLLWDPSYGGFAYAGDFPVFTGTDYFRFAIPLDMLEDDGIMAVVNVMGNVTYDSWELTDVAPNEGHGVTVEYTLTINSTAGGSVTTPGEGAFTYDAGTVVTIVATPGEDYRFVNWTGDVDTITDVEAAATTITMSGNYSITANFVRQYNLAISSTAGGSVVVPDEGTFTYDEGTEVSLVAEPDEGYRFINWTGDVEEVADVQAATTTITLKRDSTITANFIAQHDLTISSSDGGSVSAPGEGTFTYDEGAVVSLVADAEEGYSFVNWTGNVSTIADVEDAETTITMNGDYSITANFNERGCFIATAAYGTPMAEEIEILREFRDRYLLTNRLGQALTGLYYRISPPIAGLITEHPGLKPIVRVGLLPAVAMSAVAVNTTLAEKVAIVVLLLTSTALGIWATKRRGKGRQYA